MIKHVQVEILTNEAFAPFGDVLEAGSKAPDQDFPIYKYWDKISKLSFSGDPAELGYLRVYRRAFNFDKMERHKKASQAFIPMTKSSAIFAVAPPGLGNEGEKPNIEDIRAFILDGKKGVNLYQGTWHWSIFPIDENADYLMVVRRDTIIDDQEIVDLGVTFELSL